MAKPQSGNSGASLLKSASLQGHRGFLFMLFYLLEGVNSPSGILTFKVILVSTSYILCDVKYSINSSGVSL